MSPRIDSATLKIAFLVVVVLLSGCNSPQQPVSLYRGGSNFVSYTSDPDQNGWASGVLRNYLGHQAEVDQELTMMRLSGQRTLRIIFWHEHGGGPEQTTMDSTGGVLQQSDRDSVTAFLSTARSLGFANLEVAFAPWTPLLISLSDTNQDSGPNYPGRWQTWNEAMYQENFGFIADVRSVVRSVGFNYYIDLMSEGLPWSTAPSILLQYCRRLWADYTTQFGKDDTVGFSLTGQFSIQPAVYDDNPPRVLDVHVYYPASYRLRDAIQSLQAIGYNQQLIIGETWYNNNTSAQQLINDETASGVIVLWVTQWPEKYQTDGYNVDTIPIDFDAYRQIGL